MNLSLFYLSGNTTGGWVTYTAHLLYGLKRLTGINSSLYKVGNRTERKERPFGYDLTYRNLALEDSTNKLRSGPGLIVSLQKNYRPQAEALLEQGAWIVVHDPAEFKNLDLQRYGRYIVIRRAVQNQITGSRFLPHPYERTCSAGTVATDRFHACSIARIDFDKHTHILLEANRRLPDHQKIRIHGFENRIYTRFKIVPNYPEWQQSVTNFPRERRVAPEICHLHTYSCDMSLIKGDGGGTQYTFLEAFDAGSINVVQNNWIQPDDEMIPMPNVDANCVAVGSVQELVETLKQTGWGKWRKRLVLNGEKLLTRHDPVVVAGQLIKLLRQ